MLTRKQKDLLFFIRERMTEDGVPPSFDEMKTALGLRSKSGIHRLIMGLEERGFIKRLPHRARALEILRLPEAAPRGSAKNASRVVAEGTGGIPGDMASLAAANTASMASLALPFYGRIAAGTPIEALADPTSFVDVPPGLLARRGKGGAPDEHYALEISGDSMIEAGIMDGDRVIIQRADHADNGAIVVALVDGAEATLKYIYRRSEGVALVPANRNYETRILPASRIRIQGKLVGLIRQY